ncbi:C6 finger domain-containing protein [Colletotrichum musicola]|uniref:C6 finger domain-containing protein n=1 Tax=Colletotrichum musicola TaxID=2175873 RepID=A0A8H6MZ73_9PEZI|nr:C6 finger domain-containing protein [Colletotrichum musicola]
MGDYYHHFLTSISGVTGAQGMSPQEAHPPQFSGSQVAMMGGAMPGPYSNLGYFTGFPDPVGFSAPKSSRNRRKSAPGLDHVKHRRTRSGCYMCRSRRVKCDETRPVCDRCRKGSRECIYPEPPVPKGSISQTATTHKETSATQQASPDSSNDAEDGEEDPEPAGLDTIIDEDEGDEESYQRQFAGPTRSSTTSSFNLQRAGGTRQSSETPSYEGAKSASPSASIGTSSSQATTTYMMPDLTVLSLSGHADWSHLPPDLRQHLDYFCENVTHYHYCMLTDAYEVFRVMLPNFALQNEALLYAVVGFAAYQRTLQDPNGKMEDFLKYYNKSVILLLNSLKRKEKHSISTLLTVLQLATIEEYLGDWINLMGHQKAAYEMLTHLFTPETASQNPLGRMVISWYGRFDLFIAIMGGFPTMLPKEWFTIFVEFCDKQATIEEDNLHWKMEAESGRLRVISREMSTLFARGSRGQMSPEDFATEHERILKALHDWKDGWDHALTDPSKLVTDLSHARALNEDDIVNPFVPGVLYDYPVFSTTLLTSEWNSTTMMHKCQSPTTQREALYAELKDHAYAICQIFEAVENWPAKPKGSLILIQACIALSALFLPQDPKHHMWIRRKFALLETMGYIHPITLRSKMAELFHEPSCVRWWLPNDEGYSPILQSVRTFADERNANAISTQMENLREVRHIFAKMQMVDQAPSQANQNTTP